MKVQVADNSDLAIPSQLVAELTADPGEQCWVEADPAGARFTVSTMDPRIARAYGSLETERDIDQLIEELRGHR